MSDSYYPRHGGEQGASSEELHIAWLEDRIDVLTYERDEARAEVERLTKMLDVCSSVHGHNVKLHEERKQLREALRTVAERQREADRKAFAAWLREVHATGFPHETPEVLADAVDAGEFSVSLVTEDANAKP